MKLAAPSQTVRNMYVLLGIAVLSICVRTEAVEVFFSPGPDCENQIVQSINSAEKEIVAAVYSLNNVQIVDALKKAHKRKVSVRVLTDRVQASNKYSGVVELYESGLPIRVHSVNKIEHNKFGVFDGKKAVTGSFNWTNAASNVNSENCLVLNEENAIKAFHNRFEELWKVNAEDKSVQFLKTMISKRSLKNSRSITSHPSGGKE